MSIQTVAVQMTVIFIIMILGYALKRKHQFSAGTSREMSRIVSDICNPALLLVGAINKTTAVTGEKLLEMVLITLAIDIGLLLFAQIMGPILFAPKSDWNMYKLMTVFGNTGMIGIPVAASVLGNDSLVYMAIFNLFYFLLMYIYTPYILDKEDPATSTAPRKPFWKNLANSGTVAAVISIFIFMLDFPVPKLISETLNYTGNSTIFLSVIIIGASMGDVKLSSIFSDVRLYLYTLIRLILLPLLGAFIASRIFSNPLTVGVVAFILSVPNANMPAIMCTQRGMDSDLLSRGIILTTMLAPLTVTIVALFV